MTLRVLLIPAVVVLSLLNAAAQRPLKKGWHLLDRETDGYFGISLQRAYDLLANRTPQPVVVAVIDSGIDTTHEDLRARLWHNHREMPGNGYDEDGNGYVDDLHGWNFLGSKDGRNVEKESSEAARLYHVLSPVFEQQAPDTGSMDPRQREQYALWQQVSRAVQVTDEDRFLLKLVGRIQEALKGYDSVIAAQLGQMEFNALDLEQFHPANAEAKKAKLNYLRIYELLQIDPEMTNIEFMEEMSEFIASKEDLVYLKERPAVNYRREITGDDDSNWLSRDFGNADVMGSSAMHGTHVAGIIAADRHNGLGIEGVADQVQIMPIRVVPKGDEHDKDVALGIRYAVDNGARIINMSFGKSVSPHKGWVDEAVQYAASKNVLLVHAAGNDGANLDSVPNFPNARFLRGGVASNMITVGASSDSSIKGGLIADFTNYGQQTVDVLAPGVKIYSTVPAGNKYSFQQGTSMAAPVVSGIAALLLTYFPDLSAADLKRIIEASADTVYRQAVFARPGSAGKEPLTMSAACRTGGVVNAARAVQLALEWEQTRSKTNKIKK